MTIVQQIRDQMHVWHMNRVRMYVFHAAFSIRSGSPKIARHYRRQAHIERQACRKITRSIRGGYDAA